MTSALQEKNEALALRATRISEGELEEMRREFESRLATAERKVYALTKERDALKKGTEKLADYNALVVEKDEMIKQVGRGDGRSGGMCACVCVCACMSVPILVAPVSLQTVRCWAGGWMSGEGGMVLWVAV